MQIHSAHGTSLGYSHITYINSDHPHGRHLQKSSNKWVIEPLLQIILVDGTIIHLSGACQLVGYTTISSRMFPKAS